MALLRSENFAANALDGLTKVSDWYGFVVFEGLKNSAYIGTISRNCAGYPTGPIWSVCDRAIQMLMENEVVCE